LRDGKVRVRDLEALEDMLRDPHHLIDGEPFVMD
jgi:hypothetical protein